MAKGNENTKRKADMGVNHDVGSLANSTQAKETAQQICLLFVVRRAKLRYMMNMLSILMMVLLWLLYDNFVVDFLTRALMGQGIMQALKDQVLYLDELYLVVAHTWGLTIGLIVCVYNGIRGGKDVYFRIKHLNLSMLVVFAVVGVMVTWLVKIVTMRLSWWSASLSLGEALTMARFTKAILAMLGFCGFIFVQNAFFMVSFDEIVEEEKAKLGISE